MYNIPKIHLGRNMCVHPFFRIFFFCLFERAEGSTRAVIVLSDLYLYPYFSIFQDFRSLDLIEQCMMHSSFIFLSFFFYVRCFVQLNRATFNRPVATPLAFFQFLLRGVQCIFFFLHLLYPPSSSCRAAQQRLGWITRTMRNVTLDWLAPIHCSIHSLQLFISP